MISKNKDLGRTAFAAAPPSLRGKQIPLFLTSEGNPEALYPSGLCMQGFQTVEREEFQEGNADQLHPELHLFILQTHLTNEREQQNKLLTYLHEDRANYCIPLPSHHPMQNKPTSSNSHLWRAKYLEIKRSQPQQCVLLIPKCISKMTLKQKN